MSQEEKQLLLVDICGRLPYDVEVHITFPDGSGCGEVFDARDLCDIEDSIYDETDKQYPFYLPYLRPMSSMTEEERMKIASMANFQNLTKSSEIVKCCYPIINYCYSRHLDINELINKGLALEAPDEMYNIK
ncbi:MAG: hypothetical protein J6X18_05020 [Bacteroidales bacterium]|nr:hypothetical protein [Bacteroidales bacterium]